MMLDIVIDADPEWDSTTDWATLARSAAQSAIATSAFPQLADSPRSIELSVRLTGDEQVRALNVHWRGKDRPTNVLSFPMADEAELTAAEDEGPELMLGDIILARGVCQKEAEEKGISFEDHAAHLLVHGTLHLLGYDHSDERDAADMEAREIEALKRLGIADPYGEG
jgi:probable rRNA maturation factor